MSTPADHSEPNEQISRRQFLAATGAVPFALTAPATKLPTNPPANSAPKHSEFIQHGTRTTPHVALTFHGAGTKAIAEQILATTKKLKVPITVFAVGTWVVANPEIAKALISDGHEMANHTYSHPALRHLARPAVAAEISGCASALEAAIGQPGKWFRPSGTPTPTAMMLEEAAKAGYSTTVGYDVDPMDYQDPGTRLVVSRTLAGAQNGSIISLHFGHRGTADALEGITTGLRAKGLSLVRVSDLLSR